MGVLRKVKSVLLGGVAASLLTFGVQAAPIVTVPVGLSAGDTYRLAFVTSTTRDGISSDIADYNAFVNSLGLAATGISGWTAIASTSSVDARDNTNTNFTTDVGTAIYLLDGTTKIADDNADLWDGTIDAALSLTENSNPTIFEVWTGTDTDGTAFAGGELGTAFPIVGSSVSPGFPWLAGASRSNPNPKNLYALSGVLTVVPEPASLALFGLGLAGLVYVRRRKAT